MLRFGSNRWWVFILALSVFLVCACLGFAHSPKPAYAGQVTMGEGPSEPPQPGTGDPDVPITPGAPKPTKRGTGVGAALPGTTAQQPVLEGGSTVHESVWVMRLRLYLTGFRIRLQF